MSHPYAGHIGDGVVRAGGQRADGRAEVPEAKLIVPGDPAASYLMKKVRREDGIAGKPMPPGKALTATEIQILETWISGLK